MKYTVSVFASCLMCLFLFELNLPTQALPVYDEKKLTVSQMCKQAYDKLPYNFWKHLCGIPSASDKRSYKSGSKLLDTFQNADAEGNTNQILLPLSSKFQKVSEDQTGLLQ